MFRRYSPQFWKQQNRRKKAKNGLFGGQIMSMEKVNALSKKIKNYEKKEQESLEKAFEIELAKL